jgi:transcriptional regulator NrdR family protein
MKCPFCHSEETMVTDSRPTESSVRRRRECQACRRRFTTHEMVMEDGARFVPVRTDKLRKLEDMALGMMSAARTIRRMAAEQPELAEAAE